MFGIIESSATKKQSGFSMIEMVVVISVTALIGAGALSYSASSIEAGKVHETKERINEIFDYINQYEDRFSHLPCPANPALLVTAGNFGVGTGSGDEPNITTDVIDFGPSGTGVLPCTGINVWEKSDAPGGTYPNPAFVVGGMVPVRTLNISQNYAFDAWGRRLMYRVDQNLTWVGPGTNPATNDDQGGFTDRCRKGDMIIRSQRGGGSTFVISEDAAVVILSAGPNGHGAWRGKGGSQSRLSVEVLGGSTGNISNEMENSYGRNGVVLPQRFNKVFVQRSYADDTYDDILEYRPKWWFDPVYEYAIPGSNNCMVY